MGEESKQAWICAGFLIYGDHVPNTTEFEVLLMRCSSFRIW